MTVRSSLTAHISLGDPSRWFAYRLLCALRVLDHFVGGVRTTVLAQRALLISAVRRDFVDRNEAPLLLYILRVPRERQETVGKNYLFRSHILHPLKHALHFLVDYKARELALAIEAALCYTFLTFASLALLLPSACRCSNVSGRSCIGLTRHRCPLREPRRYALT